MILSVSGRAHAIFRRLRSGPATAADLIDATGADDRRQRSKSWRALDALRREGLILIASGLYRITSAGEGALADLDAGFPVSIGEPQTSVRVFASKEAA